MRIHGVLAAFALFALAGGRAASAAWVGKLDMGPDVHAVGFREIKDGQWLAGASKRVWHLDKDGRERFSLSLVGAWNAENGNRVFGLSAGVPLGTVGDHIEGLLKALDLDIRPWLRTVGNWVTFESFVGYRPVHTSDVHDLAWGFGGKVRIPLDLKAGL